MSHPTATHHAAIGNQPKLRTGDSSGCQNSVVLFRGDSPKKALEVLRSTNVSGLTVRSEVCCHVEELSAKVFGRCFEFQHCIAKLPNDTAVERRTHEGAQRPRRPSVGNGGLGSYSPQKPLANGKKKPPSPGGRPYSVILDTKGTTDRHRRNRLHRGGMPRQSWPHQPETQRDARAVPPMWSNSAHARNSGPRGSTG
jgi:hypothetical protein